MKSKFLALLAGGVVAAVAPAAMSACVYTLTTDAPTYNVGAGTATVKVYLTETLTDGSTSFVNDPLHNGMFSAEIAVSRTSGDAAVISAVTRNAAQFADPVSYIHAADSTTWTAATSPTFADVLNINDFNAASGVMFSGGKIWLGDFTVAAGAGTNPATFSVSVAAPGSSFVTNDIYVLDADPVSQGLPADAFVPVSGTTFQVAVPEPATLGLIAVSGLMLLRRR